MAKMSRVEELTEEWRKLNEEFTQLEDLHKEYKIKVGRANCQGCNVACYLNLTKTV